MVVAKLILCSMFDVKFSKCRFGSCNDFANHTPSIIAISSFAGLSPVSVSVEVFLELENLKWDSSILLIVIIILFSFVNNRHIFQGIYSCVSTAK